MAFSLLVNAASSRNRLALKTRIGILQVLPVLIRSVATPAGRKSLCTKSFRPAGFPQACFFLPESQRPNDRTADDQAGNHAHKENYQFHDASKKTRRHHAPCGST